MSCTKGSDKACLDAPLPYGAGSCCAYEYMEANGQTVERYTCKSAGDVVGMASMGGGRLTIPGYGSTQSFCAGAANLAVGALASAAIYTTM